MAFFFSWKSFTCIKKKLNLGPLLQKSLIYTVGIPKPDRSSQPSSLERNKNKNCYVSKTFGVGDPSSKPGPGKGWRIKWKPYCFVSTHGNKSLGEKLQQQHYGRIILAAYNMQKNIILTGVGKWVVVWCWGLFEKGWWAVGGGGG